MMLFKKMRAMFVNNYNTISILTKCGLVLGGIYLMTKYKLQITCVSTYDNTENALMGILCPGILFGDNNTWSIKICKN